MNIKSFSWRIGKDSNSKYINETDYTKIEDIWLRGSDPHFIILTVNRNNLYIFDDKNIKSDVIIENKFDGVYLVKVFTSDLNGKNKNKFEVFVKEKGKPFSLNAQTVLEMD